jgi:hypothetical protein
MDKRFIAVALVLIVGSVGFYLILFPLGSSFHFEKRTTADNEVYLIGFRNIQDCEITVSFVNDSSLLYSLDIEMYGFTSSTVFYLYEDEYSTLLNYYTGPNRDDWTGEDVRVKSLNILLGTGKAYNIAIAGANLTGLFTYSNGALIGQDSYLSFYATSGSASLSYNGNDIDDSTLAETLHPTRMEVNLGIETYSNYHLSNVHAEVDLPYLYYGDVDINADTIIIDTDGWEKAILADSYFTPPVDDSAPRFFLDLFGSTVEANLFKPLSP